MQKRWYIMMSLLLCSMDWIEQKHIIHISPSFNTLLWFCPHSWLMGEGFLFPPPPPPPLPPPLHFLLSTLLLTKNSLHSYLWRLRCWHCLKGQCQEIFDFRFFFINQFPQTPEYTFGAVSNFCENSRRCSQFKVHHRCHLHRWRTEKIFNEKSFHYLFYTFGVIAYR